MDTVRSRAGTVVVVVVRIVYIAYVYLSTQEPTVFLYFCICVFCVSLKRNRTLFE